MITNLSDEFLMMSNHRPFKMNSILAQQRELRIMANYGFHTVCFGCFIAKANSVFNTLTSMLTYFKCHSKPTFDYE